MLLNIDLITVDYTIQSRVSMSNHFKEKFKEAMREGREFPPIIVFQEGKKYWLADGFHRMQAAKEIGRKQIDCDIRDGDRRDAIIFSAGANRIFSIPRKREDINKSLYMLFGDKEWFSKSSRIIGEYVGAYHKKVITLRNLYCIEHKIPRPVEIEGKDGRSNPITKKTTGQIRLKGIRYVIVIKGKEYNLGRDLNIAKNKAKGILDEVKRSEANGRKIIADIENYLNSNGFDAYRAELRRGLCINGLGSPIICQEWVIIPIDFENKFHVAHSVGLAVLNAKRFGLSKMIILCTDKPDNEAGRIAEELGIKFVLPEELITTLSK